MYYVADKSIHRIPNHLLEDSSKAIAITYTYSITTAGYVYQKISPTDDMRFVAIFLEPEPELHTYLKLLGIPLLKVSDTNFLTLINRLFAAEEYEKVYE